MTPKDRWEEDAGYPPSTLAVEIAALLNLSRQYGIEGYYVRIGAADAASPYAGFVPIKNRTPDHSAATAESIVSPDALARVRFGLRAADPQILNTGSSMRH